MIIPPEADLVTNSEGARPGVAETHSAFVFFVGDRAYKVKKPVDLGFLDFRPARHEKPSATARWS